MRYPIPLEAPFWGKALPLVGILTSLALYQQTYRKWYYYDPYSHLNVIWRAEPFRSRPTHACSTGGWVVDLDAVPQCMGDATHFPIGKSSLVHSLFDQGMLASAQLICHGTVSRPQASDFLAASN